ncbi:MAG: hypothetical protein J5545_03730 [Bacteroidaceae bacterium]|nr:hypothetical protein [Bacteroidaceae bacterium]
MIKLRDIILLEKERLATGLFYAGFLFAYFGSLHPWFMWPLATLYPVPAALCFFGSLLVSNSMENPIFTRRDFLLPVIAFIIFATYERVSNSSNLNAFLMMPFRVLIFFCMFRVGLDKLRGLMTFLSKLMGAMLALSLFAFFLYLSGFPLPGSNAQFGEFYSFTNFYFFLVEDHNLMLIIPRFCSFCLEPSHIGGACAFLLFSQLGQWRKWYNLVMLATLFFTFSVAAYVYIVVALFSNVWIQRRHFVSKLLLVLAFLGVGTIFTFTYNGGNNLVHDLIMLRLEIDDGEMAGDNRVTGLFDADYNNFIHYGSFTDIMFGRDFEVVEFGNSGYKVFFYENGIVGILLLFLFYGIIMWHAPDKRAMMAALFLAFLYFVVSAFMLWEYIIFPIYAGAYLLAYSPESPTDN